MKTTTDSRVCELILAAAAARAAARREIEKVKAAARDANEADEKKRRRLHGELWELGEQTDSDDFTGVQLYRKRESELKMWEKTLPAVMRQRLADAEILAIRIHNKACGEFCGEISAVLQPHLEKITDALAPFFSSRERAEDAARQTDANRTLRDLFVNPTDTALAAVQAGKTPWIF